MAAQPRDVRITYGGRTFDVAATYVEAPSWEWRATVAEVTGEGASLPVSGVDRRAKEAPTALAEAIGALLTGIEERTI